MDYKEINDYEVLYLVSEDMDASFDILFQKYLPIIKAVAKRYFLFGQNHGVEFQDLVQEGYLGLNNAITTYNSSLNTIFYTYACLCIERNISAYCRSISAQKHELLNTSISDDKYSCTLVEDFSDMCSFYKFDTFELQEVLLENLYLLNLDTRCVFLLRFHGFSYMEISKLLDISLSMVDAQLSKARRFMKKRLESYF